MEATTPPTLPSITRGPSQPVVRDITMGQLLAEAAAAHPERIALIAAGDSDALRRQWTYRALEQESIVLARALLERFEPGERIAVWAPNIPEWILLQFASALAGTVLVTVNPAYQSAELAYVLKQSRSAGIFLTGEYRGNLMAQSVEQVRGQCQDLREVILLENWQDLVASGERSTIALPLVQPGDACMIQYTSGTTGFPKGALLHHRGLVNNGAHSIDRMAVSPGAKWLTAMPLFHTGGCVICVLGAISVAATQLLVERFEPGLVLQLIEEYGVEALLGVPTMLIALLEHPDFSRRDLSSLQSICSGGSTVPAALVEHLQRALDARFTIVFGQTESSPVSSMTRPDDTLADKANTLGGPMPSVEIKIIDPQSGEIVPLNTLGEYCTRGYNVMQGYFEMVEATAATIDAEGWLHTGDLCSMDERGYCKVEGRLKDMIIRGGENIYPREIEDLLFAHDSVGEVAVVGLPDDRLGEVVAVFIRPATAQAVDKEQLFAYLRESLSPQKTPKYWFSVEQFPMTGSGKIQKFELRKQWQAGDFCEL